MPDPFQPLTLKPEVFRAVEQMAEDSRGYEWGGVNLSTALRMAVEELREQARAAASLRQQLEEANKRIEQLEQTLTASHNAIPRTGSYPQGFKDDGF